MKTVLKTVLPCFSDTQRSSTLRDIRALQDILSEDEGDVPAIDSMSPDELVLSTGHSPHQEYRLSRSPEDDMIYRISSIPAMNTTSFDSNVSYEDSMGLQGSMPSEQSDSFKGSFRGSCWRGM